MERKRYGLIGTLLIHLSVLVLLFNTEPVRKRQMNPPKPVTPNSVEIIMLPGQGEANRSEGVDANGNQCPPTNKNLYDGVGFIYYESTGQVINAPTMLPAYQAGIRIGDLLLNNPDPDADGIEHLVILKFQASTPVTFHIKTIKICFKEKAN